MRIAVVTPIPTPYRDPFWEVVSQQSGVELMVIYCARGKADRPWKDEAGYSYRREFPKGYNFSRFAGWGATTYWNPLVVALLKDFAPEAVLIGGYNHPTMLRAIRYCRKQGIRWYLMSESWTTKTGLRGFVKDRWLIRLLNSASGALPTGSLARTRLSQLGVSSEQQVLLPNVPNVSLLQQQSQEVKESPSVRQDLLGSKAAMQVVLFAARMIPKKRPLLVLEAFAQANLTKAILVMLGDGPLLAKLSQQAKLLQIDDRLILPGFVDARVVHQWMAIADLFVQPSRETWGVAPIEATACGANVIVSKEVGSAIEIAALSAKVRMIDVVNVELLATAIREGLLAEVNDQSVKNDRLDSLNYETIASRLLAFLKP